MGDRPFAVVGQSFGGQPARAVTARYGDQVLGSAPLVPVVRWGEDRTLPAETVLGRDEDLLAGLPAADRELFGYVTARLDRRSWELFEEYLLPGRRDPRHGDWSAAGWTSSTGSAPGSAPQERNPQHGNGPATGGNRSRGRASSPVGPWARRAQPMERGRRVVRYSTVKEPSSWMPRHRASARPMPRLGERER